MKTAQIDHEFHHKAQLPTSCDNFIFTDWFYKLTSSLSTNNCNKEEFKVLTGNHKHCEWIELWFSTFISLIGLISQVEFNNRRVKSTTSQQSSRAFHLTWTSTQSSSDLKVFHQKNSMHNDLLDKRRRAWSQENVTKPISTDAKHEISCSEKRSKSAGSSKLPFTVIYVLIRILCLNCAIYPKITLRS